MHIYCRMQLVPYTRGAHYHTVHCSSGLRRYTLYGIIDRPNRSRCFRNPKEKSVTAESGLKALMATHALVVQVRAPSPQPQP